MNGTATGKGDGVGFGAVAKPGSARIGNSTTHSITLAQIGSGAGLTPRTRIAATVSKLILKPGKAYGSGFYGEGDGDGTIVFVPTTTYRSAVTRWLPATRADLIATYWMSITPMASRATGLFGSVIRRRQQHASRRGSPAQRGADHCRRVIRTPPTSRIRAWRACALH